MPELVASCVWTTSAELIMALDDRFGPPVDSYVNGSQVWLRDDGPGGLTLEWRLHPVPAYSPPPGVDIYEVFERTAMALAGGEDPPASAESLWDGLEAFAAYGGEVEPATLASSCASAVGIAPEASGLVDHGRIGDEWERTGRRTSIVAALLAQLGDGLRPG